MIFLYIIQTKKFFRHATLFVRKIKYKILEIFYKKRNSRELHGELGVNIAGCFCGEFGVAEGTRSLVRSIISVKIPFVLNNINTLTHTVRNTDYYHFTNKHPYRINIINVNADESQNFLYKKGPEYFSSKYSIGRWSWELSSFPQKWDKAFAVFNEIWSISSFCTKSLSQRSPIPVITIPHAIEMDETLIRKDRTQFSLPQDAYIFLFIFDMLSVFERKNPLAIVEAFHSAFQEGDDVCLVLKCMNSGYDKKNLNLLKKSLDDRTILMEDCMNRAEVNSLLATCDCYVSLHRSEGFGLTIAEAMYLEKPVIATGYSGNMDFMNEHNSFPVRYKLTELEKNYGSYEKGAVWAEPDIKHAAEYMRLVYEKRDLARNKAVRAAQDVHSQLSPGIVGKMMKKRLIDLGLYV